MGADHGSNSRIQDDRSITALIGQLSLAVMSLRKRRLSLPIVSGWASHLDEAARATHSASDRRLPAMRQ